MNSFTVQGTLPGLNEYVNACRASVYKGARMKKDADELIGWYIRMAIQRGDLKPPKGAVVVHFTWYEKDGRRDVDNVAFAKKFIFDALVKNKIIRDDRRKYVKGFTDAFREADKDYILVELEEIIQA